MRNAVRSFKTCPEIIAGPGALAEAGRVVKDLGSRCVIVTGRGSMRRCGTLRRAVEVLESAGVEVDCFEGVEEEPSVETVDGLRELAHARGAQVLVGLGGGSAMDAAKAAAGLANEGEPTAAFLHEQKRARRGIPLVTVPTTSGTGAEVTANAVISDKSSNTKLSIRNGAFLAEAAIVDPELTLSCPPRVTAESGMDALTQAVESFVSIHATPLTEALSFEAFRLMSGGLERAYLDGADLEARTACTYGSLLAGMALSSARLGAVHGMAHAVGAHYNMPHGLVCAVLLPEVLRMNRGAAGEKIARLEGVVETDLVGYVEALNEKLGINERFARFAFREEEFEVIAGESLPSGSLKANPKKFSAEDVVTVLRAVSRRV